MRLKIPICVPILFLNVGRKYQTTHLKPHYSANFTTVPVFTVHHNWRCIIRVPLSIISNLFWSRLQPSEILGMYANCLIGEKQYLIKCSLQERVQTLLFTIETHSPLTITCFRLITLVQIHFGVDYNP